MSKYWMSLIGFSPSSTTLSLLLKFMPYLKDFHENLLSIINTHTHNCIDDIEFLLSPHSIKSQLALILVSLVALMSFYCLLLAHIACISKKCTLSDDIFNLWLHFSGTYGDICGNRNRQHYTSYTHKETHTQALTHLFVMFVTLNMISVLLKYLCFYSRKRHFLGRTSVCCC